MRKFTYNWQRGSQALNLLSARRPSKPISSFAYNWQRGRNENLFSFRPSKPISSFAYLVLLSLIYSFLFPQYFYPFGAWAYSPIQTKEPILISDFIYWPLSNQITDVIDDSFQLAVIQDNTLIQTSNPINPILKGPSCPVSKKRMVIVTAYSSTPDQTDDSPFITASGTYVRDGIVAANFLKFGTQVKFPRLYGDKVFVVEDRMALKNSHKIDIWMPARDEAIEFGVKKTEMIIL